MKGHPLRKAFATLLSILLALSVPLGSAGFPVRVGAETSGDYQYTVDGGTGNATIDLYTGTNASVAIPATLGGAPVTAIGPGAFSGNVTLTQITLPAGIAAIGDGAFASCPLLSRAIFLGDAPTPGSGIFDGAATDFTVLYIESASGFSTPTWNGYPAEVYTVPVHYDLQDGSQPSDGIAIYGETLTEPSPAPTWTGHVFGGWYKDALGDVAWKFASDTVTAETTLYAKWTLADYTATFVNHNGTADTTITQAYDTDVYAPATDPTRTGYTFGGWFLDDVTFANPATFPFKMPNGGVTLYAKWIPIDYTITFKPNNGGADVTIAQGYETQVAAPTTPTRMGYVFGGWYTDDGTFLDPVTFPLSMPLDGLTVYAKWIPIDYTITFKPNNGGADVTITQGYETQVAAPTTPTRIGYLFGGWYTDDGTFLDPVTFPLSMPLDGLTVYAKWTIGTFMAAFKNNNGQDDTLVMQAYDTYIYAPSPSPTRTGYAFGGWYLDDVSFAAPATFPFAMPEGGVTLFAKWTPIDYTITLKLDNGGADVTITQGYGTLVSAPTDPTRAGYSFGGWYTDDGTFLHAFLFPASMPYGGITAVAKWTPQAISSSTYTANAGSGYLSKIGAGTTVATLVAGLDQSASVHVFNGATEVTGAALVGTGMTVKLMDGATVLQTLAIVVTGDVSGDGRVTLLDFAQLQSHLLNRGILTQARFDAGDVSGDGRVSLLDFAQLQSFLLGKSTLVPRSY